MTQEKDYTKLHCSSCDKHGKLYYFEWKTGEETKTTHHCKQCIQRIESIIMGLAGSKEALETLKDVQEEIAAEANPTLQPNTGENK